MHSIFFPRVYNLTMFYVYWILPWHSQAMFHWWDCLAIKHLKVVMNVNTRAQPLKCVATVLLTKKTQRVQVLLEYCCSTCTALEYAVVCLFLSEILHLSLWVATNVYHPWVYYQEMIVVQFVKLSQWKEYIYCSHLESSLNQRKILAAGRGFGQLLASQWRAKYL